ncbi:MAG: TonB C-terminal domain-containing protein [Gemmatimonadales bacterium]
MGSYLREHTGAVVLSTGLHVVVALVLTLGVGLSGRPQYPAPGQQVAIEATIVDEAMIQREMARLEELEQAEILRQQEEERVAREQADAARRQLEEEQRRLEGARQDRERATRVEEQRLADLQQQREDAERLRAEEEARLAKEREAEAQRQREEQQRLAREAEEQRRRAESEAELQRVLAVEDERRRAEQSGLLDQYIRLIVNRIEQNWIRPATAQPGLECEVRVMQIPSGDIVDVRVDRCNGDDAVIRSIEAAVLRSSPLPRPPVPSLFERTLNVVFAPDA